MLRRITSRRFLFSAYFDADPGGLNSYLEEFYATVGDELRKPFRHCVGFDEVKDPKSFRRYVKRCQIETTMTHEIKCGK